MTASTVHILLVEDNEIDVEAIRRAFRQHRIANPLYTARDGIEALDILRGNPAVPPFPRPYLILLDLNLPKMNGIEMLRELRADPELADAIVFVLTTSRRDEDKLASYELNVAGYLVKQDVGADFLRLVGMLDHYWRIVEFPPERGP